MAWFQLRMPSGPGWRFMDTVPIPIYVPSPWYIEFLYALLRAKNRKATGICGSFIWIPGLHRSTLYYIICPTLLLPKNGCNNIMATWFMNCDTTSRSTVSGDLFNACTFTLKENYVTTIYTCFPKISYRPLQHCLLVLGPKRCTTYFLFSLELPSASLLSNFTNPTLDAAHNIY